MHIRTAASPMLDDVDAWLQLHQVDTTPLADAFDACTHILVHYERAPELVLIGGDRLLDDERQIIRYVRHTWPAVAILVYASDPAPVWSSDPLLAVAVGRTALQQLLKCDPMALVMQIRRASASHVARDLAIPRPPSREPAAPRHAPTPTVEQLVVDTTASSGGTPAVLRVAPLEPTSVSLTAEELAALLDAADD